MRYDSIAVHGGRKDEKSLKAPSYPLYLTSTFVQDQLGAENEYVYSRSGNPTRDNLEAQVAQLENADFALATASGMAATALALSLVRPGENILINSNVYGGTWSYVNSILQEHDSSYQIVQDLNQFDFSQATPETSLLFIETPSNPLLEVTDLEKVIKAAHENNIKVVVDNTFMTSYYQKPLDFGADIVVYSATKYYGGHADLIAGLVLLNDPEVYEKLKLHRKVLGAMLSPFDSFLLNRGIKTMPLRMDRQAENTQKIVAYLQTQKAVEKIYYPGLTDHPYYDIQQKQATGNGAVFSVVFAKDFDLAAFCAALKIFDLAVSLGGVESLVCHPASMTHESYSAELQAEIGIEPQLLRFAVGIEDYQDLLADVAQAIQKGE